MGVLISGSAGPAQGGWTVRPNRPVSLSDGPLGCEGRVQHWIQVQFQWVRARWADVKAMLGMESWGHKPTCRGPTICPGAPHPFDIGGGAGGALSPFPSQSGRAPWPGFVSSATLFRLKFLLQHTTSTGHVCTVLCPASLELRQVLCIVHGHHLTRDSAREPDHR